MIKNLGVQIYTLRDFMTTKEEVKNTFKKVKEIGYDYIQTAGIPQFLTYSEYSDFAQEAGIKICGTHDNFNLMKSDIETVIKNHKALNTSIMGIGAFGFYGSDNTWNTYGYHNDEQLFGTIDSINKIANAIYPQGFKLSYHNHSHEFAKYKGKTIIQHFVENTDPMKVSICLDIYWAQFAGADVRQTIEDLKNRIEILHLKDMGRNEREAYMAPIGEGNMFWDGIIQSALDSGVKYFVVEQDDCNGRNPFECIKQSYDFLHSRYM